MKSALERASQVVDLTRFIKAVRTSARQLTNKAVILLLLHWLVLFSASARDIATVKADLVRDIQTAQQRLSESEKHIGKERQQLAKQVFNLQQSLTELQDKAAVAQRLSDENTLSLQQLQNRLANWQQQAQYQQNLIKRFLRQHLVVNTRANANSDGEADDLSTQLSAIKELISTQQQALYPQWHEQQIVMANGVLQPANVLAVGPVSWFVSGEHAGLLSSEQTIANKEQDQVKQIGALFSGQSSETLMQLSQGSEQVTSLAQDNSQANANAVQSVLQFDPTLKRMIIGQSQQESALEHLYKGGPWALPIVAFGLFALVIALIKAIHLFKLPQVSEFSQLAIPLSLNALPASTEHASNALGAKTMQSELVQIANSSEPGQVRDDLLFNQLMQQKQRLDNWIGAIAITASISPLLGLLGTVSGMIETFNLMTIFGSGDPEVVSGGIAQALITTELGLVVAIPALILNALLSRKAKSYFSKLEAFAIQLSQAQSQSIRAAA